MTDQTDTGTIEIELNGKQKTLVPSLKAAKVVNGQRGFQTVLSRLSLMDFDAYVEVVAAGLGSRPAEVEDAVWKTGLPNLTEPLSQDVLLLANAGRPLSPATEG
ncbi:MAG: hypothetical protein JWQ24_1707 [Tardiphaga sp.]|nr:hypothetical protein [Tardiphaga sp.]